MSEGEEKQKIDAPLKPDDAPSGARNPAPKEPSPGRLARRKMFRIGPTGEPIPVTKRLDRQGKRLIGSHVTEERYKFFKVIAAVLGLNTDEAVNRGIDLLAKEAMEQGHKFLTMEFSHQQSDDPDDNG